jgi:hypothetical protein
LSWWRRVKISASSEDFDRNNPMTAHQISLRMSPIGASIARFAAIRQLDRVYGSDRKLTRPRSIEGTLKKIVQNKLRTSLTRECSNDERDAA